MSITFTNVHKTLRKKDKKTVVLEGAAIEFPGDRIVGVLAAPQSGKSTTVKLSTGKLRADIGRVRRSSLVSFPVAGGGVFHGALTGRENLAFLCRVFGFDPVPIIRFVLDFTEIGKAIDKPFKDINRDERTKLLFASCYAIPFETYIVDETLLGGRGSFRARCEELVLERMKTSGFLVFTSTPNILRRYCTDIFIIDQKVITPVDSIDAAIAAIGADRLRDGEGSVDVEVIEETEEDQSLMPL